MEDLQQIPWSLVLIASEILLGGVFGIVLLLMKFPAARLKPAHETPPTNEGINIMYIGEGESIQSWT